MSLMPAPAQISLLSVKSGILRHELEDVKVEKDLEVTKPQLENLIADFFKQDGRFNSGDFDEIAQLAFDNLEGNGNSKRVSMSDISSALGSTLVGEPYSIDSGFVNAMLREIHSKLNPELNQTSR